MAYDKAILQKAADETGLSPTLLERLISAESSGDPAARSSKGAEGLTQLSAAAAQDEGVADRLNPEQNVLGGAKYLKAMIDRFGSLPLGLAAYNMGPGALEKVGRVIPASVKGYVEKVAGAMPEASAATPGSDVSGMDKQIQADASAYRGAVSDFGGAQKDYDAALKPVMEQLAKREKSVESDLTDIRSIWNSRPQAPAEKKVPTYVPPPIKDPTQALLQIMPLMLLAGSKMGRNKGLALMKSTAAVLNGVHDQNNENRQQAREDARTHLDEFIEQAKLEHDRYMDILNDRQMSTQERISEIHMLGVENEIDQLRLAGPEQKLKMAHDYAAMLGTAVSQTLTIRRDMSQDEIARLNAKANQMRADADVAKIPPATRAYNDALARAKADGKTDDEAQTIANVALKEAEYAAHPTAMQAQGRAEEKLMEADPKVKTYRTTSQFFGEVDSIKPADMETANGQIRILDAFTKMATGGQAIRQFMATSATKYLGLMNEAEAALHRLTTTKGAVMSKSAAQQYLDGAKALRAELEKNYDNALANHARIMDQRGVDPAQAIDRKDLERIMEGGLYAPSKAPAAATPPAKAYAVGDIIDHGGKKYRVTGGDPSDPDIEPVQ